MGGGIGTVVLYDRGLGDVPAIVRLAHDIPTWFSGLSALEHLETAHSNTLRLQEMCHLDIDMPVQPRPDLVSMSDRRLWELAYTVQPCLAIIKRNYHALDFVTAAIVCVSSGAICLTPPRCCKWYFLALSWLDDDGVQVLLLACCVWVSE